MTPLARRRLPLLVLAGLSLLAGLWAGLTRLGWLPGLMAQSAYLWDHVKIRMTKGVWYHTRIEVVPA